MKIRKTNTPAMKLTFFITAMLMINMHAHAQIMISMQDMPEAGDHYVRSFTADLSGIDYEKNGENRNWDFSLLSYQFQQVDTFVSVFDTPPAYQFVFIPFLVSNLAREAASFDFLPGFPLDEVYDFYKNSDDGFVHAGMAFSFSSIPFPLKYDSPDVIYSFPLQYNDTCSSASAFGSALPGLGYFYVNRTRNTLVDGWGTILTPFGEFETLRLVSQVSEYDSVFVDTLGAGFPVIRNYTEYKWLAKGSGLPLMQITVEGLLANALYLDSLRGPANISHNQAGIAGLQVYPNPVRGENIFINAMFFGEDLITLELISPNGSQIALMHQAVAGNSRQTIRLELPGNIRPSGICILRISGNGFSVSRKIIVI